MMSRHMAWRFLAAATFGLALGTSAAAQQTDDRRAQATADWLALKAWFDTQTGDRRAGADYWAANRSKANHLSCTEAAPTYPDDRATFLIGCQDSKARLDVIDARRLNLEYRAAFNLAGQQSVQTSTAPVQSPAVAAPAVPDSQDVSGFFPNTASDCTNPDWAK